MYLYGIFTFVVLFLFESERRRFIHFKWRTAKFACKTFDIIYFLKENFESTILKKMQ